MDGGRGWDVGNDLSIDDDREFLLFPVIGKNIIFVGMEYIYRGTRKPLRIRQLKPVYCLCQRFSKG